MRYSVVGILLLVSVSARAADLPNILWLTSEDNGPHLGCYGDPLATTPALDTLAAKGMRYTNAISNAPVCAPARTTIISGLYPPSTGSEHMRSHVPLPAAFQMYPQILRAAGYYCTNNSKEDYNLIERGKVWDESSRDAHWKNRQPGQPFFSIFNYTISHESRIRDKIEAEFQIHDPMKVRVPAYHPDTPEVRRNWAQYYDRITMMDRLAQKALREVQDSGLADDTIVFYYGDHGSGMPRSKRWPYNSGLQVPMIVHFPEKWKHLAPKDYQVGGESDRLVSFVDLAPTLLSIAGIEPPKWMQGQAFAGKFETPEPEFSFGFRGRMDERYDMVRAVRGKRFMYLRHYMPHREYGQYLDYMFVTQTTQVWHKMYQAGGLNEAQSHFWKTKPSEELYDLNADLDEVNNLATSPEHQATLQKMRNAQQDWARRIRDVGYLSEWETHHRSAGSTPYEMGHDAKKYDLDSIMKAANVATSQRASDLPAIQRLMEDNDSAVRYWGAMGLLIHGKRSIEVAREKLHSALQDDSPIVRITAAETLGRFGNDDDAKKAVDTLIKYADPGESVYLGIAAWNALDFLDERVRPRLAEIKNLSPDPTTSAQRAAKYSTRLKIKTLADLE